MMDRRDFLKALGLAATGAAFVPVSIGGVQPFATATATVSEVAPVSKERQGELGNIRIGGIWYRLDDATLNMQSDPLEMLGATFGRQSYEDVRWEINGKTSDEMPSTLIFSGTPVDIELFVPGIPGAKGRAFMTSSDVCVNSGGAIENFFSFSGIGQLEIIG